MHLQMYKMFNNTFMNSIAFMILYLTIALLIKMTPKQSIVLTVADTKLLVIGVFQNWRAIKQLI